VFSISFGHGGMHRMGAKGILWGNSDAFSVWISCMHGDSIPVICDGDGSSKKIGVD